MSLSENAVPPISRAEAIDLLKEIRELLKERNEQLDKLLDSVRLRKNVRPQRGRSKTLSALDDWGSYCSGAQSPRDGSPSSLHWGESRAQSVGYLTEDEKREIGEEEEQEQEESEEEDDDIEQNLSCDGMDRIAYYRPAVVDPTLQETAGPHSPLETDSNVFVARSNWRYWRPAVTSEGTFERHQEPASHQRVAVGKGCPDYMPEWEMISIDGEWHHIDGEKLDGNIDYLQGAEFEWEERLVPYSLAPSWMAGGRSEWEKSLSTSSSLLSGLSRQQGLLQECIGNLYSVPPDLRIPLTFEKDELRLMRRNGSLRQFLHDIHALLNQVSRHGSFQIIDCDDFGGFVIYEGIAPTDTGHHELDGNSDPLILSRPALLAEKLQVNIPPVSCFLMKQFGAPATIIRQGGARWYRVLTFRGLERFLRLEARECSPWEYTPESFSRILFREINNPDYDTTGCIKMEQVLKLLKLHISPKRRTETVTRVEAERLSFHISWFKLGPTISGSESKSWNSGPSQPGADDQLQEVAFTMAVFLSRIGRSGKLFPSEGIPTNESNTVPPKNPDMWYWSILLLAPSHFPKLKSPNPQPIFPAGGPMLPVTLIAEALQDAVDSWEEIANHLSVMIDKPSAVLDPSKHDEVLIAATIREWEIFWKVYGRVLEAGEHFIHQFRDRVESVELQEHKPRSCGLSDRLHEMEARIHRLRALQTRLQHLRDQIKTLRDGLFNARVVTESKATTELGENVKLLTYVSIFYLPLSCYVALWSIGYGYHPMSFTAMTAVLSVTTYLIVMNLNHISQLSRGCYKQLQNYIVASMLSDPRWAPLAATFTQCHPDREMLPPSQWDIFVFLISQAWKWLISLREKLYSKVQLPS
ncbi:hypothetical protein ARAM_003378 [Aspergillus rambellii]|uniref:Uncharacterized protein n=1 Tax=Aspergillus rambellii TaxID=308745 RepID=A0A0F8WQ83_9EURO|nr:hypothetical protein ARAM_003378 [Aspergillus rambellii]